MIQYPILKIKHIFRNLSQQIIHNDIAIIGSYHGGNVGDMILGKSIEKILKSEGLSSDLQTLHNLEKWPKRKFAIIGGGAVGYNEALEKVYDIYKNDLNNVFVLGVDFNEPNLTSNSKLLLESASFISCRSSEQQIKLSRQLSRDDIYAQPDIGFTYPITTGANSNKKPILLINAIPLYGYFNQNRLVPELQFKIERPEIFDNFDLIHKNYINAIIKIIQKYKMLGYQIETLPFSTEDDIYAKKYLSDLDIKINTYSSNPSYNINLIRRADTVLATRYHATIFSLRLNKNIIPFAYAKKNEELLSKIGANNYASILTLLNNNLELPVVRYDKKQIRTLELEANKMIEKCISYLNNKMN